MTSPNRERVISKNSISAPKTSSSIQIQKNPHADAIQEFNDVMLPVFPLGQEKKKIDERTEKVS